MARVARGDQSTERKECAPADLLDGHGAGGEGEGGERDGAHGAVHAVAVQVQPLRHTLTVVHVHLGRRRALRSKHPNAPSISISTNRQTIPTAQQESRHQPSIPTARALATTYYYINMHKWGVECILAVIGTGGP
eukprot:227800-Pyramimonas_sp.AAC.1